MRQPRLVTVTVTAICRDADYLDDELAEGLEEEVREGLVNGNFNVLGVSGHVTSVSTTQE